MNFESANRTKLGLVITSGRTRQEEKKDEFASCPLEMGANNKLWGGATV